MYDIEEGIPIPSLRRNTGLVASLELLEPLQSILVPDTRTEMLSKSVYPVAKRLGRKFTMRTIGKDVRIWRVE